MPQKIMINGLPGNVAKMLVRHAMDDERFELIPFSLTGPEITEASLQEKGVTISLVGPDRRESVINDILKEWGEFITIDFTHPAAINANAEFYCRHGIPFVMGTTGGDRQKLVDAVESSTISAVIAPNMTKQIVGFQAMMAYAAEQFPGLFAGYHLTIEESHQQGKADTSGTARAMVGCFNRLGVDYNESDIIKVRDPEDQKTRLGVPEAHLGGHGWHTYSLVSPDGTANFRFVHNINGRDIYAQGTFDAVLFLGDAHRRGQAGRVFSMIDVLKGV